MSFTDFIKNDNKSIIWGLLQEGGIFNDIPNANFENVKRLFESSILSMKPEFDIFFDKNDEGDDDYDKKASEMIMNSNKNVIKKMIYELDKFKKPRQSQSQSQSLPPPNSQKQNNILPTNVLPIPPRYNISNESPKNIDSRGTTKKPKIEEIYRADDLQNHRMSELEVRLKEKQEEMDTMLNNKKPTSIDFSDSSLNDNKLASDEMERLLSQALSSRQREIEQFTTNSTLHGSKNAEEWISGSNDPVTKAVNASIAIKRSHDIKRPIEQSSISSKKNVSFNVENNEKFLYDKHNPNDPNDPNDTNDPNDSIGVSLQVNDNVSFLTKLKRKNPESMNIPLDAFITDCDEDTPIEIEENYSYRRDGRYGGDGGDVIDPRDFDKLEHKINILQTYMESIKNTQDKIVELLQLKTSNQ